MHNGHHRRAVRKERDFDADFKKAIPDQAESGEIWKGVVTFCSYFAHSGQQLCDEETNYDVWCKSILYSGGMLGIYYTFDDKTVWLQSAVKAP